MVDSDCHERLQKALQTTTTTIYEYSQKDCILYALSLGFTAQDLSLVYEHHQDFHPFPTLGVLTGFVDGARPYLGSVLPNFKPANLLHGEHTLHIHQKLHPAAKLITTGSLVHIADKGKAAIAVIRLVSKDQHSGNLICTNEFTNFVRAAGGFGRAFSHPEYRPSPSQPVPSSEPDCQLQQQTSPDQAALYRLNGDYNPLHIDSTVSQEVGFERPILHGLCTFGIAAKHVLQFAEQSGYGNVVSIKVRFANVVIPGDLLCTRLWRIGQDQVAFQVKNVTRDTVAITNGKAMFSRQASKL